MLLTESLLRKYQLTAVQFVKDNPKCALFIGMGLGKTIATLTAIRDLMFREFEVQSVLVIAPKRVAEHVWTEEVKDWEHVSRMKVSVIAGTAKQRSAAMATKAHIYLLGRDNVVWYFDQLVRPDTSMLVIDESTSFKNQASKRFKKLRKFAHGFDRVVLLTGTPAPKGYIDLWAQFFLLDAGKRLMRTFGEFRTVLFSNPAQYVYKLRKTSKAYIDTKIRDITLSMEAKDYLELPEIIYNTIKVYLPPALEAKYDEFEEELVLELLESEEVITAANSVALTGKLLQFSNGAIYDEDRNVHGIHDLKLDALEELLDTNDSVLLAWNFRHDRDRILKRFAKHKPRELKTGQDIKDWNDGKIKLFMLHPASGGHGLNLQRGGHVIVWFGVTFDLELYQQFNARLPRPGQENTVVIHHIVTEGTADLRVLGTLAKKGDVQQSLMDAVKSRAAKLKSLPSLVVRSSLTELF